MSVRDRLVPAVAGLAVLMVGVVVIVLLRSAADQGTQALERAKVAQVRTTADSFDARVQSGIASLGGLGARPWQLTPGSAADQKILQTFSVDPNAQSGSFLVDSNATITDGVLLRPGRLGSTYDPPGGWAKTKAALRLHPGRGPAGDPLERDHRAAQLRLRRGHPRCRHRRACAAPTCSRRR